MKTIAISALCVALLACGVMTARSDVESDKADVPALKPVAVVSVAGYDRLMSSLAFIGKLSDNPDLDKTLDGLISVFTQGQGLNGLDRKRPWGVIINSKGDDVGALDFQGMAFLPVEDMKKLLDSLAALIGVAEELDDGVFSLEFGNDKIYLKEKDEWAYISRSIEELDDAPSDPIKVLDGLDKKYEIATRVFVQNIPEVFRSMMIDQLREGMESGLDRSEDETDEEFEQREKVARQQIETITTAIQETNVLTLGWAVDQDARTSFFDFEFTAVTGSKLARQLNQAKEMASSFAGFLPADAAVTFNAVSSISPEDVVQTVAGISALRAQILQKIATEEDSGLDDDDKEVVQEIVGQLFDAMRDTVQTGKLDVAGSVELGEKTLAVIAGVYVADPGKLETALRKFVDLAKKEKDFPGINYDADKHGDVRFHTMVVPVDEEEPVSRVLGGKLDVAVGFGPQSVYLALGTEGLNRLKAAIDGSKEQADKKVSPMAIGISLAKVLEFASAMDPQPMLKAMAQELAKAEGKDHVTLTARPIQDGVNYQFLVEEGVLRLLGKAGRMATGGQAQVLPE